MAPPYGEVSKKAAGASFKRSLAAFDDEEIPLPESEETNNGRKVELKSEN
jgi:hypothetical protein